MLDGVQFPGSEPQVWIAQVVRDSERGVRPAPDFDVRAWQIGAGHVAIVRIAPTSTPPCLTNGTVFERVPGQTITVRDPQRLAALFARGDKARADAQARADDAAAELHDAEAHAHADEVAKIDGGDPALALLLVPGSVQFTVAVATTGNRPDIASRLFQQEFADGVWRKLQDRPSGMPGGWSQEPEAVRWSQSALMCRHVTDGPVTAVTRVRVRWDGAAALHQRLAAADFYPDSVVRGRVQPAWQLVDEIVGELGGFGEVYVAVRVTIHASVNQGRPAEVFMRRGPCRPGVRPADVASFSRELERALGRPSAEPADRGPAQTH